MERAKRVVMGIWGRISEEYAALVRHRYTTVAGTLAFFSVLSLAPFIFWLTLLFGQSSYPALLARLPLFDWAEKVVAVLMENAAEAGKGAGAVFLLATLWSSTGFFYHLRRSGEILYGCRRVKHGWKVRLSALFFTFCLLLFFAAAGFALLVAGIWSDLLPAWIALPVRYLLLFALGTVSALLLNVYICPYRCRLRDVLRGSLLTALLWLAASGAFSLYLALGNAEKLYGALALLVVFLIWLYWMMICFTAGAVHNRTRMEGRRPHKVF